MPRLLKNWWVCNVCRKPITKVGARNGVKIKFADHQKICPNATYTMRQI